MVCVIVWRGGEGCRGGKSLWGGVLEQELGKLGGERMVEVGVELESGEWIHAAVGTRGTLIG